METCATEIGLLKKKPCGQPAVAKCANCEMPLCSKHALAQLSPTKQRTGKFMCAECDRAQREADKTAAPRPVAKAAPAAGKPAAAAPKSPAATPATPAAAAQPKAQENSEGSIDFTPSKK